MKFSCNGCRILRKGCSDDCIIRPCLDWINSPESQANATLFLAKFYGRIGLLNLIRAAPQHLGQVVFKSLLYEACGRLVKTTHGSLGLFWTGEWAQCEAAVNAVLTGSKIDGVAPSDWHTSGTLPTCMSKGTNVDDVRGRVGFKKVVEVIQPKPRVGSVDSASLWKPNWENESVETQTRSQDVLNRVGETELDLELTLSFPCQSTCGNKTRY